MAKKGIHPPGFSEMTESDQIISSVGDGVTVHDRDFRIIYQNQTMKSIFGECAGKFCYEAYQQLDSICSDCPVAACFSDGEIHTVERTVRMAEKTYVFETCASPIHDKSGNIVASVEVVRNATKRNEEQERIARLKDLYEAISRINKAIMLNNDKDILFRETCRILVNHGKLTQAGIECSDNEAGQVTFYHDQTSNPSQIAEFENGIRSSAALPLVHEGKSFGVLNVFSDKINFFDLEVIGQLQEMVTSISFAIGNYSREEKWRQTEEALRDSEERLRLILEGSDGGYWNWDIATGAVNLSPSFVAMLGYSPKNKVSTISAMMKLVYSADKTRMQNVMYGQLSGNRSGFEVELRMVKKSKGYEWLLLSGKVVSWDNQGSPLLMSGVARNITEKKQHLDELKYKCTHDQLTGLYNRAYFDAEIARVAHSRKYPVSIVVADVDGLKFINDSFGHSEGDRVIKQAALALQQAFRGDDVVARIGGDEFAVILKNSDSVVVQEAIGRILQFQAQINDGNNDFKLSMSLGSATAERRDQLTEAFNMADSRMYDYKFLRKSSHLTSKDMAESRCQALRKVGVKVCVPDLP